MKVNIHNQCSGFELTNREYFSNGADWNGCPSRQVKAGNTMSANLIPLLATFESVLAYELKRKHARPDNPSKSNICRLFVAWKFEGYKNFYVFLQLIEYEKQNKWNEIKLEDYYQRYVSQLSTYTDPIENTWLTRCGKVLMTRLELDFTERDGVLNITISEGAKDDHTKMPVWISQKR
jgi:hypothetical protein